MNNKRFISMLLVLAMLCSFALAEESAAPEVPDLTVSAVEADPVPEIEISPETTAAPEASPEPDAGAAAVPGIEPDANASSESSPEPVLQPSPASTAEPASSLPPEAAAAPSVKPTANPMPEPAAEPASSLPPEAAAAPSVEPTADPTPEPTAEPTPVPLPESISLPETLVIGYKERVENALAPEILPENSVFTLSYSSSKTRYVEADAQTGALYGARTGSAVVTVSTDSGLTASCKVTVKKAPSRVKVSAGETTLAAGQRTELSVSFGSSSYFSHSIAYSSSDESIARVEDGHVIALSPGSAKISAEAFNGKKGSITIKVLPAPESVHFTDTVELLGTGQAAQLTASVNEGSRGSITFSGSDASIAIVTPDGSITAVSEGEIIVTATAHNGISAEKTISVVPAPTALSFIEETIYIGKDESLSDALRLSMDEGSAAEIRFSSSSTRYVSVDAETGEITGERVGKATITAAAHNGVTAQCSVIVEKAPSKVKLSIGSKTMGVGQSQMLDIAITGRGHYSIKSSKTSVITADADGMLHAVGEGKAKITVTTYNGRSASVTITVAAAPTSLTAAEESISLGVGESKTLSFTADKGSYAALSYASSAPSIASVDESGKVTAITGGSAVITANTQNGISASTVVNVLPEPEAILFEGEILTIAVGERRAILFSTQPEQVQTEYSYKTDNTSIVRVDQKGVLSGYGRGEASVSVTASNGVSGKITVRVVGYSELNNPYIMAHRGASGYYPDNSLDAFEHAAELGADMVELDVRETKDGKLVVFHDAAIEINGREKDIEDLKLSEIRKANPDVCTLEEALECIAGTDMKVMIELKITGVEKAVVDCVKNIGILDRALYGSFKLSAIKKIKRLLPEAHTVYIMQKEDVLEDVLEDIEDYSFDTASLKYSLITEKIVRDLHLAGKQVVGWTLNLIDEIKNAVSMGVDGVTTDYPDRVK